MNRYRHLDVSPFYLKKKKRNNYIVQEMILSCTIVTSFRDLKNVYVFFSKILTIVVTLKYEVK